MTNEIVLPSPARVQGYSNARRAARYAVLIPMLLLLDLAFPMTLFAGQGDPESDVIAKVGDQPIRLSEIDMMINSSNVVGLSLPPPGTKARNQVRLTLLDKMISANLLYLDALRKHVDRDPVYHSDVKRFSDAMLASLYRQRYMVGELKVSEKEVQDFYHTQIKPGTPFTGDLHVSIEARLRKEKFEKKTADLRARLRENADVVIDASQLDPVKHPALGESDIVAHVAAEPVTWAEAKPWLGERAKGNRLLDRLDAVNKAVDFRVAINKAKAAGLESDPAYIARVAEFKKVRMINLRRSQLDTELAPSDKEIRAYFEQHLDRISMPAHRKVQMVVLKTKGEAVALKKKIDSGKLTIYQAAEQYSIDPNAKHTLGEIGWVAKGSGFPALDKLTFALKPGKLGGPVQSPAGWHLVKVLDVRAPAYQNIDNKDTRRRTRRMLVEERQNQYVINLRKNVFPVEVYQDVFDHLIEQEAQRIQANRDKAGSSKAPMSKMAGQVAKP